MGLVVERIGLGLVLGLILEALIFLAHRVARDQGGAVVLGQRLEVGLALLAGVGRDQGLIGAMGGGGCDHRQQQFPFAAGAVALLAQGKAHP